MTSRRRQRTTKSRCNEKPAASTAVAPKGSPTRYTAVFFVTFMCLTMGSFLLAFHWWIPESKFFGKYLNANAWISSLILRLFGEKAMATGTLVSSPQFSLQIKHGCDALQSTAFLILAMLGTPIKMPVLNRLVPILIGTIILALLNLVRILSLYYVGVLVPDAFEWVHIDLWQAVFVFAPLVLWLAWLRKWVGPKMDVTRDPS